MDYSLVNNNILTLDQVLYSYFKAIVKAGDSNFY